jgi:peroxiredoxin Q/BCP
MQCVTLVLLKNEALNTMSTIEINSKAPAFSLLDHHKKEHHLSDYQGQWLIIFFYPKDNTPGCTVEACHFRDNYSEFSAMNTKIVGINTDKQESHTRFIKQQKLPFPLLIDQQGEVSQRYDSLFKLGFIKFCKRHSFIINPEGKIVKIYRKVTPSMHIEQVLSDLKALQKQRFSS